MPRPLTCGGARIRALGARAVHLQEQAQVETQPLGNVHSVYAGYEADDGVGADFGECP